MKQDPFYWIVFHLSQNNSDSPRGLFRYEYINRGMAKPEVSPSQ